MTVMQLLARFERDRRPVLPNRELSPAASPEQGTPVAIVRIEGPLRAPGNAGLIQTIEEIVRRGERRVLLDVAAVTDIDAAGVGELAGAFNTMQAFGGVLQIVHLNGRVRRVLEVAGLFTLLTTGTDDA